jgi:fumarate reductase subunit D
VSHRISNEPLVWLPFSAGGMFAALFIPVHIALFGVAIPLGWLVDPGAAALSDLATHLLVRIYLVVLVAGCLFHAAHRIRFLLVELGWRVLRGPTAITCYTLALLGSIWAGWVVLSP